MYEVLATISIIAASQGFILFLGLTFNKRNNSENRIMAFLILLISVELLFAYFYYKTDPEYLALIDYSKDFFEYSIIFNYGPVTYLYAMKLTTGIKITRTKHLLHFIPFLISLSYSTFIYIVSKGDENSTLYQDLYYYCEAVDFFISFIMVISIVIYFVTTFIYLNKFTKKIKRFFSNTDKLTLVWLKAFILIFLIYSMLLLIFTTATDSDIFSFVYPDLYYFSISIIIFIFGYFSLAQPGIFNKIQLMEDTLGSDIKDKEEKYKKTKLSENQLNSHLKKIEAHIINNRSFTDPEINLQKLAEELDILPHYISQVINSKLNKNFYQFINYYRVEEIKKALKDRSLDNQNIITIAFDAGFNSKSSFNSIFKQLTGMTPSQYRKKNRVL